MPGLTVLHADRNRGKGHAIRLGLKAAAGTIVAIQDADLELDPAQLSMLVQPILDGEADVVYGSRFLGGRPNAPWRTIAANRFLTAITNVLYRASITDMETCYKVMRADVARSLSLEANRFDIEPEITAKLLRQGHEIVERPVRFDPRSRAAGKKIGWRDGVDAGTDAGEDSALGEDRRWVRPMVGGRWRVARATALAKGPAGACCRPSRWRRPGWQLAPRSSRSRRLSTGAPTWSVAPIPTAT